MSLNSAEIQQIRTTLVDTMSPVNSQLLRSTLIAPSSLLRFFSTPRLEVSASVAYGKVAYGEHRGLDTLHLLTLTSENPVQLANGMGAIAAAANVGELAAQFSNNPSHFEIIQKKIGQDRFDFQYSLFGNPKGSTLAEEAAASIRTDITQCKDDQEVIKKLMSKIRAKDKNACASLVEMYFFNISGYEDDHPWSALRDATQLLFLTASSEIFKEVENILISQPDSALFNLIYGRQASFWRDFRLDLMPNIKELSERIVEERRHETSNQKIMNSISHLGEVGIADLEAKEEQHRQEQVRQAEEKRRREEEARVARERAEQARRAEAERIQREQAQRAEEQRQREEQRRQAEQAERERILNQERLAWFGTKGIYETDWNKFIQTYEQQNGQLTNPPKPKARVDLLIGGIDILHKAIFNGDSDQQLRAGMETILPKVWDPEQLAYAISKQIHPRYDARFTTLKPVDFVNKVLTDIVFVEGGWRPEKLGKELLITPLMQSRKEMIVRAFSRAAHPDRKYTFSDAQSYIVVTDFLKAVNRYRQYWNNDLKNSRMPS